MSYIFYFLFNKTYFYIKHLISYIRYCKDSKFYVNLGKRKDKREDEALIMHFSKIFLWKLNLV